MDENTAAQIDALARALQDPHLDAANRAQILTLIDATNRAEILTILQHLATRKD